MVHRFVVVDLWCPCIVGTLLLQVVVSYGFKVSMMF